MELTQKGNKSLLKNIVIFSGPATIVYIRFLSDELKVPCTFLSNNKLRVFSSVTEWWVKKFFSGKKTNLLKSCVIILIGSLLQEKNKKLYNWFLVFMSRVLV